MNRQRLHLIRWSECAVCNRCVCFIGIPFRSDAMIGCGLYVYTFPAGRTHTPQLPYNYWIKMIHQNPLVFVVAAAPTDRRRIKSGCCPSPVALRWRKSTLGNICDNKRCECVFFLFKRSIASYFWWLICGLAIMAASDSSTAFDECCWVNDKQCAGVMDWVVGERDWVLYG